MSVVHLARPNAVEAAWDAYQAHCRKGIANPSLWDDEAFRAENARLHRIFFNLYAAEDGQSNVVQFRRHA